MALQKSVIDIPLTGGLNQKVSSKLLPAPGLLTLTNGRFLKEGSISKRYGFTNLGQNVSGSLTYTPSSLASYKDELLMLSESNVYSYAQSTGIWTDKGSSTFGVPTLEKVTGSNASASGIDVVTLDNIRVVTWLESTTVYYSVIDVSTGSIITNRATLLTSASDCYPRLVSVGHAIYVFYNDSTNIKCLKIPTFTPTSTTTTTVYATLDASFDAFDVVASGSYMYLTFLTTTANTMRISKLDADLGIYATTTETTIDVASSANLSTYVSGGYLNIAWYDGSDLKGMIYTTSLSQILAETIVASAPGTVVRVSTGAGIVYYTISHGTTSRYNTYYNSFAPGPTIGTPTIYARGVGLVSKISTLGANYHVLLHESSLQSTYFVMAAGSPRIISKFAAGTGGTHSSVRRISNCEIVDTTKIVVGCTRKGRIQSENATLFAVNLPHIAIIDSQRSVTGLTNTVNDTLLMSTGALYEYDGAAVKEYGFHIYPEGVTTAIANSTGTIPNGVYLVYALYEWTDARGNRHQSAPSPAVTVTLAGAEDTITVTVPALRQTDKTEGVTVRVFITDDAGTIAYSAASGTNPNPYLLASADTVDVVLTADPATLTANEILYTTGGQLENIAAPAHSFHFIHDNRIVITGLEDKSQIRFSKDIKPLTGIGFNEDYSINLDPTGGNVTGGASLQDYMVLFKETAIYTISGSGPNDTGANNAFSTPTLVTADVGCRDPRSILQTPDGIFFMSNKGIYQIDSGLNVQYIGNGVEDYNSQTIVSAELIKSDNELRFLTNAGVCLVYNTFFKRWSVFTMAGGLDATVWKNDSYVYLTSTKVMKEDTTTYQDDGSYVPLTLRTAWINLGNVQGYQRVYRLGFLGTYYTNNSFSLKLRYDYSDTIKETHVITASDLVNTSTWGDEALYGDSAYWGGTQQDEVYQFRKHLQRQKCQSISIELTDAGRGSNTGQGYSIEGLSLQVGGKGGIFRNSSTRSI
jgi:hypothetical protein